MSQLEAFLLTVALESAAAFCICAIAGWPRPLRLFAAVIVASVVTHPVLWAVARHLPPAWWWPAVLAMEATISLIEGVIVGATVGVAGGIGLRRGLVIGVVMNVFSFGAGLLLAPLWS
jgi:hypothetical protein